jgi:protein-S-isoprenylcysteine O-methyltransferase Ste14
MFALPSMLAIMFYKMRLVETVLDQHFGNKYADYRKITKTLIPLVW